MNIMLGDAIILIWIEDL